MENQDIVNTDEQEPLLEKGDNQENTVEEVVEDSGLSAKEKELSELNDKYMRLYAEFDNYKKRTTRERIEMMQTAGRDTILALLPVLDDFERGMKLMETASDVKAVEEGVSLVHHKLKNILVQKGLVEMESKGQDFNPDFHEAITSIPAPSEDMKGKVLDELEKGYLLNEKVLRYAKVVVGN